MLIIDKNKMYRDIYNHLYDIDARLVKQIYNELTPELIAIISKDAYTEMIQMGQAGLIEDYYNRLKVGAV